jgi:hypothetical protein
MTFPFVVISWRDAHNGLARRAYFLWLDNGRPDGRDDEFWFEARHQSVRELAHVFWQYYPHKDSLSCWLQAESHLDSLMVQEERIPHFFDEVW